MRNIRPGRALAALAALIVAPACAPSVDDALVEEDGEREALGPHNQGRLLTGTPLTNFRVMFAGATLGGTAYTALLNRGSLEVGGATKGGVVGTIFQGFQGTTSVLFRIDGWAEHQNPYPSSAMICNAPLDDSEYLVRYKSGAKWKELCAGAANRAIVTRGYWNAYGDHLSTGQEFVFSCTRPAGAPTTVPVGVVTKCKDWCYKDYNGYETSHYACTRMAMFDPCARGTPGTIDETYINSWDVGLLVGTTCTATSGATIPATSVDPVCTDGGRHSPMDFEAGWGTGNSGADGTPKAAAVCLSKKRWQTLPIGGNCPTELPDPRVDNSGGVYCDNKTIDQIKAIGVSKGNPVYHLNYSSYPGIGGWQYTHSVTGRWLLTTATDDGKTPPAWATNYASGILDGVLWREVPATSPVQIKQWNNGTGFVLTTHTAEAVAAGWTFVRDEGYVVSSAAPKPTTTARKLYCYKKGGDYLTTSGAKPGGWSNCWGAGTFEGWLPY